MKTLQTQEYLRSGKTLRNLYQRFDIQHFVNEELGVVVFNYRPLSPMASGIVRECRGLVLELGTWDVVCKPIGAFFEPRQPECKETWDAFDWTTAIAMDKLDGAMVCLYHYKGEWRVSTRYSTDGHEQVVSVNSQGQGVSWRQLTELAIESGGSTWEKYTSKLDKDVFYVFELVSPENRVVVIYPDRRLHLVAAVARETLEELDIRKIGFHGLVAPSRPVKSYEDVLALIEANPEPHECEGFVVVDGSFRRLKVRNPRFRDAMRTYSVTDELSALRELRAMDVSGLTLVTEPDPSDSEPDPTGPGTGNETGTQNTAPSIVTELTAQGFAVGGLSANTLRSVLNRVLFLAGYVSNAYEELKDAPKDEREQHRAYKVWPEAFEEMDKGKSMSDLLDTMSDEHIIEALRRFESDVAR